MTIWFQIVLIFVSLATVTFILRGIRKSQVQINDSLFWIFFSVVLLIFSVWKLTFFTHLSLSRQLFRR